jgi:hypothetical protein
MVSKNIFLITNFYEGKVIYGRRMGINARSNSQGSQRLAGSYIEADTGVGVGRVSSAKV